MPIPLHSLFLSRLAAASALAISISAHCETWVVTDPDHPIKPPTGVRLIVLGDKDRLEERLTRALPSDPRLAAANFPRFMASPDGRSLLAGLAKAQQDAADAWSAGIEKTPAVVVDRKYVVYGIADVATAVTLIDRARSTQR